MRFDRVAVSREGAKSKIGESLNAMPAVCCAWVRRHSFTSVSLVAAHDFHDDAGDHEGEDEKDGVEGDAHYVHGKMLVISGL